MTGQHEDQRWNQVLRKGKHFLLGMSHPSWCPLCRIREWNLLMTTISWPNDVISHGGHWDTISECQMMVTTKKLFKYRSQSSFYETLIELCEIGTFVLKIHCFSTKQNKNKTTIEHDSIKKDVSHDNHTIVSWEENYWIFRSWPLNLYVYKIFYFLWEAITIV